MLYRNDEESVIQLIFVIDVEQFLLRFSSGFDVSQAGFPIKTFIIRRKKCVRRSGPMARMLLTGITLPTNEAKKYFFNSLRTFCVHVMCRVERILH